MLNRRQALKTIGAGTAFAAFPGSMLVQAQENSITITSLGGKWEQSIREHFIPLFKKRTGADVKVVLGTPSQWSAQVEALPGKPPLDAIDNSETLAITLQDKGLVQKLTVDKVPNLANTPDLFRKPFDDYGASYQYSTSALFYNTEKFKNFPKTWPEFFERAGKGEFDVRLRCRILHIRGRRTFFGIMRWRSAAALPTLSLLSQRCARLSPMS